MPKKSRDFLLRWDGDRQDPFYDHNRCTLDGITLCADGLRREMHLPIPNDHPSIVLRTTAKPPRHKNYWNLDRLRRRTVWYNIMPHTRKALLKEIRQGRKYAQILY